MKKEDKSPLDFRGGHPENKLIKKNIKTVFFKGDHQRKSKENKPCRKLILPFFTHS
jgi:hypothetical protein